MKEKFNKFKMACKKILATYKFEVCVLTLSIITMLVGIKAIGFLYSFLVIIIFDCLTIALPLIIKMYKRKKYGKKEYIEEAKDEIILEENINNYYEEIIDKEEINEVKSEGVNMPKKKTKKSKFKKGIKVFLLICLLGFILAVIAGCIFLIMIVKDAPELEENDFYSKESTIIYDVDGKQIAKIGNEIREKVTYDELPEILIDAIVATEDSRFFQHNGFDLPRFLKASFYQVTSSEGGGASTLTMQLAKNNVTAEKYNMAASGLDGIKRKFTDIYVSIFELEKKYTKQEILELYANTYYMGSGAYGVEQASLTYFGKHVKDISLAEAALLAGLFQAPNAYDPYMYPEDAEDRRETVLYLMERHGYITSEEKNIALELTVDKLLAGTRSSYDYQSFIDTVLVEVEKDTGYDPYTTPMLIYTTMNSAKQKALDDIFNGNTYTWENDLVQAGMMVTDVNTGAIVAVGGGRNKDSVKSYNYATMIKKQIGSTAKPLYDYGPAIEYNNAGSGTIVIDDYDTYSDGHPIDNVTNDYNGILTYRYALSASRNIPALRVFKSVSNKNISEFVNKLGLSPEYEGGFIHEAHSIGGYNGESPLTMAAAYSAYANGGYYIEPYSYTKIVYRETEETYEHPVVKSRAMSEETAYIVNSMLQTTADSVLYHSTINGSRLGAKTGTTNFDRDVVIANNLPSSVNDLWLVGFSPDYCIALWYGYDEIYKGVSTTNSSIRIGLWEKAAYSVFENPKHKYPTSNNVQTVSIEGDCVHEGSACLASEFTPARLRTTEIFKKGTAPTYVSDRFAKLPNVTNLNYEINNNYAIISWDEIETPKAIDSEYLAEYFKTLYSDKIYETKYNERIAANTNEMGTIIYNVYIKDSEGGMTFLGSTDTNSYTYKIKESGDLTFVVKTSYTKFLDNASDGATLELEATYKEPDIKVSLVGEDIITNEKGTVYKELGIKVTDKGINKTSKATYTTEIKDYNNTVITNVPSNEAGTYIITYNIIYEGENYKLTRTVIYK